MDAGLDTLRVIKVAETFTKKGNTEWAKAKSGEGDEHYGITRGFYATADKARQKDQELLEANK